MSIFISMDDFTFVFGFVFTFWEFFYFLWLEEWSGKYLFHLCFCLFGFFQFFSFFDWKCLSLSQFWTCLCLCLWFCIFICLFLYLSIFVFVYFCICDWKSGVGNVYQWMILFTFERLAVSARVRGDVIAFHILSRVLHSRHHIFPEKILSIDLLLSIKWKCNMIQKIYILM